MKNKHLVLLFLSVLLIGWLLGRFPWTRNTGLPAVDLLRLDTAQLVEIKIRSPKQAFRSLYRTDEGWMFSQSGGSQTVPAGLMLELLSNLHPLTAEEVIYSKQPDTLGFGTDDETWAIFRAAGGRLDSMRIGRQFQNANWVALSGHEGMYRVESNLTALTRLDIHQFQPGPLLELDTSALEACTVSLPLESFTRLFRQADSTACWIDAASRQSISTDSMRRWLLLLPSLNRSEVTPFFDESRRDERLRGMVAFHGDFGVKSLKFYMLSYPDLPEEIPKQDRRPRLEPCYVVESSQRPFVFYAVYDTALVHQILHYLKPVLLSNSSTE